MWSDLKVGLIAASLLLVISVPTAFADDSSHVGVKAKPIKRQPPGYPQAELKRYQQGWVQLSYVVTKDGDVIDPVIEDSSGSQHFERSALRTVKRWKYEPATWDGEPVQQCQTKVIISFAIEDVGTAVSKAFSRRYKKIDAMANEGNIAKAQGLLDSAFNTKGLSMAEVTWLWGMQARISGMAGDKKDQLHAIRKATARPKWVDENIVSSWLVVRTALEIEMGNLSSAMDSYNKLIDVNKENPSVEMLSPYIGQIEALLDSEQLFAVSAQLNSDQDCDDCKDSWHYSPLRRKVSLANVNGDLGNIELRCEWRRYVDQAREGVSWEIPESWGDCSVVVFGDPGSSFSLVEEPTI